jgi:hypothetical protein
MSRAASGGGRKGDLRAAAIDGRCCVWGHVDRRGNSHRSVDLVRLRSALLETLRRTRQSMSS